MMMNLKYEDSEGLLVELSQSEEDRYVHMDVSRKHMLEEGIFDVRFIASCKFNGIDQAQTIARLLVGIEMQPDGGAWKRGPRGEARPTDSEGNRLVIEIKT